MKNSRQTKRALLSSVMALVLCFTMLLGTTFAWFTDSVSSVNNVIKAGNLDVELYYEDATGTYVKVDPAKSLFDGTLWEPGHVEVVNLKVANEGTLALKYQLQVGISDETGSINKDGKPFKLSDHIQFAVLDGAYDGSREGAVEKAEAAGAAKLNVSWVGNDTELAPKDAVDVTTTYDEIALVVWMPETVGNEANYGAGQKVPEIKLGINLYATQQMAEEDSFGKDYDEDASYIEAWDGTVAVPVADANGVYHITSAAELAGINEILAKLPAEGKVHFVLDTNLNLGNEAWSPIGKTNATGSRFEGTFDGQGYTIYNVNVTVDGTDLGAGLFGSATNSTIKNLTVKNVSIKGLGDGWTGGLVGNSTNTYITNCHVIGGTVSGVSKVGGIVGDYDGGKLTESSVEDLVIIASKDRVAGLVGRVRSSEKTGIVTDNVVKDTKIYGATADEVVAVNYNDAGVIENNEAINVVVDKTLPLTIATAEELFAFAEAVNGGNNYSGKTVILTADIDLENKPWTAIGQTGAPTFAGSFYGNGYTISNLTIDNTALTSEHGASGLFGWVEQHSGNNVIANLNIDGVTIDSNRYSGAIAGWINIPVVNCSVNNITINCNHYDDDTDGTKVGALVGYAHAGDLTNNIVTNAVLNAYGDVGGLAGVAQTTVNIDGNIIKNVQINCQSTVKSLPGAIASTRSTFVEGTNQIENCEITIGTLAASALQINEGTSVILSGEVNPLTISGEGTLVLSAASIVATENGVSALALADGFSGAVVVEGNTSLTGAANGNGIYVPAAATLDLSGTGVLTAKGNAATDGEVSKTVGGSGIGGEGTIYIHDLAELTAEGYGAAGFGIGGKSKSITVENTKITNVRGGYAGVEPAADDLWIKSTPEGGAAIGSMSTGAVITLDEVTIDNAEGGSKSAGIGARYWTGVTVNISNSEIKKVVGGNSSAGIGGSRVQKNVANQDVSINITNSTITAQGGQYGAGIGSGYDTYCHASAAAPVCTINIDAASVINATGGKLAAGIGTGHNANGLAGKIEGTITAVAGNSDDVCCLGAACTTAQDVGFGALKSGVNEGNSSIIYNDTTITIPEIN